MSTLTREATPTVERPSAARSRSKRARIAKRILFAVGAIAALAGVGISLTPKPVAAQSAPVRRGNLVVFVDELARTRVRDRYVVSAPASGELVRIGLRAGDPVATNATLATILPVSPALLDARARAEAKARASAASTTAQQARVNVTRAGIAREHAEHDLARTRALAASGSIPPEQLRDAELSERMFREEEASARFAAQAAAHESAVMAAALRRFDTAKPDEQFEVTTPAAGRVLKVLRESAGVVGAGAPLVEIGDPTRLEVVCDLLTADAVRVRPGAKVTLLHWGGDPLGARVRVTEPAAFTRISALGVEEQRVSVVIDLDDAPERWSTLGDGYRVEARITLDERKNVLAIPLGAAFRHDGGWATFVIRDARARRVAIETGARSDAEVEVRAGLDDSDRVIVHPSERIADGVRVRVD